jgi:hypothetical protein
MHKNVNSDAYFHAKDITMEIYVSVIVLSCLKLKRNLFNIVIEFLLEYKCNFALELFALKLFNIREKNYFSILILKDNCLLVILFNI